MLKLVAINKPLGVSSFKALGQVKKFYNTKKIGHLGTLDPLAEGVLAVAVGDGTKLIPYIDTEPKEYIVEIFFGVSTDTFDAEGLDKELVFKKGIQKGIELDKISLKLDEIGACEEQVPPIFSAVKINGKRAYDLARKGQIEQSEIKPKKVQLYSYEVLNFELPILKLKLSTSSGYYVRSLVRDLGIKLDVDCFMYSLLRTKVGGFNIDNCSYFELEDVIEIAPEKVLNKFERINLTEDKYLNLRNGLSVEFEVTGLLNEVVFAYYKDELCAICKVHRNEGLIKSIRNLNL
jgi:tRNA pseudouridine55 synthase